MALEDTWESAYSRPGGLVWSTPTDQMRLAAFLVDGNADVLEPSLLEAMHSEQTPMWPDRPGSYGYGLEIYDAFPDGKGGQYNVPVWRHGGITWTHTSNFYVLPEQRFAISILSNGLHDSFIRSVVAAITSLLSLPPPVTAPVAEIDVAALDGLTGTYVETTEYGDVLIAREGDALSVEMPVLDERGIPYDHLLRPLSTRVWIVNIGGEPLDFSFIDGPNGEMYLRNRGFVAKRSPQAP